MDASFAETIKSRYLLASESKNEMEKGTILIVDDNKGVLASLELLLETEFSEIKTAHHRIKSYLS